jgi:hypothetical protein
VERPKSFRKKEMMAEVENLVVGHLRHMHGQLDRLDARVARMEKRLDLLEAWTSIAMS